MTQDTGRKEKILISGNEAIAQGAIDAGCRFYAGYPITPQNELTAYMAAHMPDADGVFIQAESEISAVNMVFGASLSGARAMTSSSSPGISLKQEGISYLAGAELPAVIVNMMRGGPGLGNISPSQSDYFQATRGGGHGDYHSIVLAPSSVQQAYDFMFTAFDLSDKYRLPAILLGDGLLGQMMEPIIIGHLTPGTRHKSQKPWALTGCKDRKANIIRSLYLGEGELEQVNLRLQRRYKDIKDKEQRYNGIFLDDASVVLVAYGSMARIASSLVRMLRKKSRKVGLIQPITLWPFPDEAFEPFKKMKRPPTFLAVEMSHGQMLEDVKLSLEGRAPVEFFGRAGGMIPAEKEIMQKVDRLFKKKK